MRSVILASGLALLLAVSGFSTDTAQVLIVDQTVNLMESMQVEILARALLSSGLFSIKAVTEIPDQPHPSGPFHFVIIIPLSGEWIWVCTPSLPDALSADLQQALLALEGAIEEIFMGERQAANPSEDLLSILLSAYFLTVGVLQGAQ